jgi:hypothetical protein
MVHVSLWTGNNRRRTETSRNCPTGNTSISFSNWIRRGKGKVLSSIAHTGI